MSDDMLKLNDDKTEFLIVTGSRFRTCKFDIEVGDQMIQSSPIARNLGVIFDSHLVLNVHITSMCRSAMYHLRRISSIRLFLDHGSSETLIHASSLADCTTTIRYLLDCRAAS